MASRYSPQARARREAASVERRSARQRRLLELTAAGRRRTSEQKAELRRLRDIERAAERVDKRAERDAERDRGEREWFAERLQTLLPEVTDAATKFLAAPLHLQRAKMALDTNRHMEWEADMLPSGGYSPEDNIIPGIGAAYHW
jgi:hypothetical protein